MSRCYFNVGCLSGGGLYVYSRAGEWRTFDAARAYAVAQPIVQGERRVIVETIPCVRMGVEYGYRHVVRDLDGRTLDV